MAEQILADLLKRLRHESGLSQSEMAEKCSVALRYYQALEYGEQDNPSLLVIRGIIEGLNLEPGEILGTPRKEPTPESYTSLLKALSELQKENTVSINQVKKLEDENGQLKKVLGMIPAEWIARLAVKQNKDLGAIAARAFLTNDISELKALQLPRESTDLLEKLMGKNG